MAQQYAGPVSFLPQPRRATDPAVTNVTTIPMATISPVEPRETGNPAPSSSDFDSVYLPIPEKKTPAQRRFRAGCALVARRTYSLVLRYRLELVPAATSGGLTALGWAQHLAGAGVGTATAYAAATGVAAAVSWLGLKVENQHLTAAGAGAAVAFADVAAAVGGGVGGVSLTASAVAAGVGYGFWVPWLREHRKHEREVEAVKQAKVVKGAVVNSPSSTAAVTAAPPQGPAVPFIIDATPFTKAHQAEGDHAEPTATAHNRFLDDVIPFSLDGETDDLLDPIRIGWDENGEPVKLTMLYRHTLVAGASDWGKSGILKAIIKKLLNKKHVELYGIDLKPGCPELGPWAPLFKKLARTPEEARELLRGYYAEGEQRGLDLEAMSIASLAQGGPEVVKWIPGDPNDPDPAKRGHGTAKYLITDELGELIRQDVELRKREAELRRIDPDLAGPPERPIASEYESGLAILRFLAMHYISATQQPSGRVFGGNTDARGNYANRINTRTGDADHAQFLYGRDWKRKGFDPRQLKRPGEVFIGCPELPEENPLRVRVEFVSGKDVGESVAHLHAAAAATPQPRLQLVKQQARPQLCFPDGAPVGVDGQPSLYRVFCRLCEEHGSVTKAMLQEAGPFGSLDTVRRAVEVWLQHGVVGEKDGPAWRYSLPIHEEEADGGA